MKIKINNLDPLFLDEEDNKIFKRRHMIATNYIIFLQAVIYNTWPCTDWTIKTVNSNKITEMMIMLSEYKSELQEYIEMLLSKY